MSAIAAVHGATPARIRRAWTLAQGPHVLAIPGTGDPDHLIADVAAGALRLTAGERATLGVLHQEAMDRCVTAGAAGHGGGWARLSGGDRERRALGTSPPRCAAGIGTATMGATERAPARWPAGLRKETDMAEPAVAYLTVLTTTDSAASAEVLARGAVEARLAACAQISAPVTSVYRWKGAIETAQEWQILFKTTATGYDALEAHLLAVHPYDTPEIIAAPIVRGSDGYLAWVTQETQETQETEETEETDPR